MLQVVGGQAAHLRRELGNLTVVAFKDRKDLHIKSWKRGALEAEQTASA